MLFLNSFLAEFLCNGNGFIYSDKGFVISKYYNLEEFKRLLLGKGKDQGGALFINIVPQRSEEQQLRFVILQDLLGPDKVLRPFLNLI